MSYKVGKSVDSIDVVFDFDTTGSMTSCIRQVRSCVVETVNKMFAEIPDLRIGIIAHGDYCDGDRMITMVDLTNDRASIVNFVRSVPQTYGGDAPEAYEQAMRTARTKMSWTPGKNKALVIIGDEIPHTPNHHENINHVDWREELKLLMNNGVLVYGVKCLHQRHSEAFYQELATKSGGFKLDLQSFDLATDTLMAICYRQAGPEKLQKLQEEVVAAGKMTPDLARTYDTLMGKKVKIGDKEFYFGKTKKAGLHPVARNRFTKFDVTVNSVIADFVSSRGITFQPGKGYYQLSKPVKIQDYKEVVVEHIPTGEMFTGKNARKILDLPETGTVTLKPKDYGDFRVYVQSTSTNRKLLAGTVFIYDTHDLPVGAGV